MAKAIAGGDPQASVRQRQLNDEVAAAINSLVRRNELTRTSGANRWTISAFLAGAYQPLDSDLTAIAALTTTAFGRSLLTLASVSAAQAALKIPAALFDHFADVGNSTTTETDLYSDTLAAGQLANNGDKVEAYYAGVTVGHATATRQLRVYFGGTLVYDSTAQATATAANWNVGVRVVRESASVVRCSTTLDDNLNLAAWPGAGYARVTGLTLSNTQVLKITGTAAAAGAATNDIVAKLGTVKFWPLA